jgi:hypothetical protein
MEFDAAGRRAKIPRQVLESCPSTGLSKGPQRVMSGGADHATVASGLTPIPEASVRVSALRLRAKG